MTAPSKLKLFRTTAFRLSLIYLALFGAAALLAIGYIYWNTTILLSRQLDQTIQAELGGLAEQYRAGGMRQLVRTVAERSETPGNSLYYVADSDGRRIAGNLGQISPQLLQETGSVEFAYERPSTNGTERRLAFAKVFQLPGDNRLLVGRDIEDRQVLTRVTRSAILWGLGFMALVGIGGALWVSRKLLARIDAISATAERIMQGDLTERLPRDGSGDELDRLAKSLNRMLGRIEQLMTGLREVSDNIAHDLKTPLTRLRNRVEEALHGSRDEAGYRETLQATIEEADGLIQTFNALLSIARLEAGQGRARWESLDAAALVADVAELYEPVAEERGLVLRAEADAPVTLRGDRQLLGQAIANLVDNAIKYGVPNGKDAGGNHPPDVCISVRRSKGMTDRAATNGAINRGGDKAKSDMGKTESAIPDLAASDLAKTDMAEIIVTDRGEGIPEADRTRVLDRFVRLEASRSAPGSGLGLSLVAAVARLHGGSLVLEDHAPGLKAILAVPLGDGAGKAGAATDAS
ncbi:ATP-binding protein [Methyloligella sp. 2.7D]|uniref:ATP-binding protein n=1 Tax=unclassified Methyloligella TaxID=2625955 RepID=UPI00157BEF64|nr:ATP-binding protein [Methyloligella sp. GL2]QKP77135.1 HAMP domain-containing protein [Methyloligella sp. GL2]